MIDTIIFDNEGVVADTESVWDKEQREFLGRRGIVYKRNRIKHLLSGRSIIEGVKVLKKEYNLEGEDELLSAERLSIVKDLLAADVNYIKGFMDFYNIVRYRYKICVATSMHEELLNIIDKKLSLNELFNGNIYSIKHVGNKSKPYPDIFLYAAQKLKSKPDSCLVIEDSPNGIDAALRAGMKCIGLATTYPHKILRNASLTVSSFSEIEINSIQLI